MLKGVRMAFCELSVSGVRPTRKQYEYLDRGNDAFLIILFILRLVFVCHTGAVAPLLACCFIC